MYTNNTYILYVSSDPAATQLLDSSPHTPVCVLLLAQLNWGVTPGDFVSSCLQANWDNWITAGLDGDDWTRRNYTRKVDWWLSCNGNGCDHNGFQISVDRQAHSALAISVWNELWPGHKSTDLDFDTKMQQRASHHCLWPSLLLFLESSTGILSAFIV